MPSQPHPFAVVREMRPEDARAFLEVHRAAVRGIAPRDYPPSVIEAWAPLPLADDTVARLLANPDGEHRLVAEIAGRVVGMGAVVLGNAELRACYVAPQAGRLGVGTALVEGLERAARKHGLTFLELASSVTAEAFYAGQGYEVTGRGEHTLRGGQRMACVRMRKRFAA